MSSNPDSDPHSSLISRLLEAMRHPWAKMAYTVASVVFFASAWFQSGQTDVPGFTGLSHALAAGGVFYVVLRAWADGAHRWLAETVPEIGRAVAQSFEGIERKTLAVVIFALCLSVSPILPFIGLSSIEPVQNASASSGIILEDYEDGQGMGSIVSSPVAKGENATYLANAGTHYSQDLDTTVTDPSRVAFFWRLDSCGDSNAPLFSFGTGGTDGGSGIFRIDTDASCTMELPGTSQPDFSAQTDKWYRILITPNYDGTADVEIRDINGDTLFSESGYPVGSSWSDTNAIFAHGPAYIDHVTANGVEFGETVSGTVTDASGNQISGATVSYAGGSVSTNSTGYYEFSSVTDGSYTLTASADGYENKSQDITVSGSAVTGVDFSLCPSGGCVDSYEEEFILEDYIDRFAGNDPRLTVDVYNGESISTVSDGGTGTAVTSTEWATKDTKAFNHNQRAYFDFEDEPLTRLTVRADGGAVFERVGVRVRDDALPTRLRIGEPSTNETVTPEMNATGECVSLEQEDGRISVVYDCEEPTTSLDFNISGPDGEVIDWSKQFDEPTSYYQGSFNDSVTQNASQSPDDYTVDYAGEWENGTSYNGTAAWSASSGDSSNFFGGPTGRSGGGGPTGVERTGGYVLIAGTAAIAYTRYGNGELGRLASSAASAASKGVKRVPKAFRR